MKVLEILVELSDETLRAYHDKAQDNMRSRQRRIFPSTKSNERAVVNRGKGIPAARAKLGLTGK